LEHAVFRALPDLQVPFSRCRQEEAGPDGYAGICTLLSTCLGTYIEVLLAMRSNGRRDELLVLAFAFLEELFSSDAEDARLLAHGVVQEDPWWHRRARPFLGAKSREEIAAVRFGCMWSLFTLGGAKADPERNIIDLYGFRDAVLRGLGCSARQEDVTGISAPASWRRYGSIQDAAEHGDSVVFLSRFGVDVPCVVWPAREVLCTEDQLESLASDLNELGVLSGECCSVGVHYFGIAEGERVWGMSERRARHLRYTGQGWVTEELRGVWGGIRAVLSGSVGRIGDWGAQ